MLKVCNNVPLQCEYGQTHPHTFISPILGGGGYLIWKGRWFSLQAPFLWKWNLRVFKRPFWVRAPDSWAINEWMHMYECENHERSMWGEQNGKDGDWRSEPLREVIPRHWRVQRKKLKNLAEIAPAEHKITDLLRARQENSQIHILFGKSQSV